ncbi:hypothetical protein SAMN05192552_1010124, partial [Natrinema hispanicum]
NFGPDFASEERSDERDKRWLRQGAAIEFEVN